MCIFSCLLLLVIMFSSQVTSLEFLVFIEVDCRVGQSCGLGDQAGRSPETPRRMQKEQVSSSQHKRRKSDSQVPCHYTKWAEDNFYRKKKCIYNYSSMWGWGRSAERMHQEWKFKTKCRSWIVFQKIQHLQELHAMETLATNRTDGH